MSKFSIFVGPRLIYESDSEEETNEEYTRLRLKYTRVIPVTIEREPDPIPEAVRLVRETTREETTEPIASRAVASSRNLAKARAMRAVKPCTCGKQPHKYNCPGYRRDKTNQLRKQRAAGGPK